MRFIKWFTYFHIYSRKQKKYVLLNQTISSSFHLKCWLQSYSVINFVDDPTNPPTVGANPFTRDIPPSAGYTLRMVDGVMHVFSGDEQLVYGPIYSRQQFIEDQNMLFALITNGPL